MSPPEVWGPAVWTLFHTLAEKVSDQAFPFIKVQLFAQIRRICGFLPCPECSADATNFLAKVNINDIKTKVDFRNTFYLFHNMVNAKKRKPLFNYSNLAAYNNYGIVPVINNFISKYNTKGNMKLLAESFQRKLVLGEFKSWFTKTIRAFVPPQTIPQPISLIVDEPVSEDADTGLCCGRKAVVSEAHVEAPVTIEEVTEEAPQETPVAIEEAPQETPVVSEAPQETPVTIEEAPQETPVTIEEALEETPVTIEETPEEAPVTIEETPEEAPEEAPVTIEANEEVVESKANADEEEVVTEQVIVTEEDDLTQI
jgi:hypothetical protein